MAGSGEKRTVAPPARGRRRGFGAAHYLVVMTMIGYTLNFMDRQIVSVLLEPIRHDLHISDGRLGLLSGLAFALFYAFVGLPLAWLADRHSRKTIISVCMAVWSLMTICFGFTRTFPQMLGVRMGVGIGEAGFAPAAFSMLADYFPRERRAAATAFAGMGSMVGTMLGLVVGAAIAERYGWRAAMFVAGAPGMVFSVLFFLTVREPERGMSDRKRQYHAGTVGTLSLLRNTSYMLVLGASMAACFVVYAYLSWMPSFLVRSYNSSTATAGLILGPLLGGVGALSQVTSGIIIDMLARRGSCWANFLPAVMTLLAFPLLLSALMVNDRGTMLTLFGLGYYCGMFFSAPCTAMIQHLVPVELRARATAVFLLMATLFGFGLGPTVVGYVSQALAATAGEQSLRLAMVALSPALLLAALLMALAARQIDSDEAKIAAALPGAEKSPA